MYKRFVPFLLFLSLLSNIVAQNASNGVQTFTVRGFVRSAEGGLEFIPVGIIDLNINAITNEKGFFELKRIPQGRHKIVAQAMGYSEGSAEVNITDKDTTIFITLEEKSFKLKEVEVMAHKGKNNKLEVRETAFEYIQPTSLSDIFILLPGNLYKESSMTNFTLNSNRQVDSDKNSSLGMAVTSDGIPQTNDGVRVQMIGVTKVGTNSSEDNQIKNKVGINSGTDMRYISTNHIQSVEVERGISPPKYGNLSSGQIIINSKYGVSPLKIRTKLDLKNKLIYAGKGFSLGKKFGTLHVGADYLQSADDIREEMEKFTRLTAQIYYNNKFKIGKETTLDFDAKIAKTISINKMKKDELTYEYDESYKSDYDKLELMTKGVLNLNKNWLNKAELLTSFSRVNDRIDRHYCVITSTPRSMPSSYVEGEHEGYYLPTMYYSNFYIENIPDNFFSQLNLNSRFFISKKMAVNFEYGADFRSTKNWGDGVIIENEQRPPFPSDNLYMRPRKNYEVPAIEVGAAYAQSSFILTPNDSHKVKLDLGIRFSQMFNLPNDYALYHRTLKEPRINASYTLGDKIKNNFRIGFGIENKFPTIDFLYPDLVYKDFWMLNAYTNKQQYRHLISYTKIFDATNKDILENKNKKYEVGYDFIWNKFTLSFTAFYEISKTGFEYFTFYEPVTYNIYTDLKEGVDISNKRPEKSDYIESQCSEFVSFSKVMNSEKVEKKGVEYRIILPKIKPLLTDIEVNGAYYHTTYGTSLPEYFYPNSKIGDVRYPYVGVYDTDGRTIKTQLNTNIWFNTHVPKFGLMFTNFFQFIWAQTTQYTDNFDGIYQKLPYEYIDFNGETHLVSQNELDKIKSTDDINWYQLRRQSTTITYAKEEKPINFLWNIKATKEFGKRMKLSFFVNGIIDYNSKYMNNTKAKTLREWIKPFFGMELNLSL